MSGGERGGAGAVLMLGGESSACSASCLLILWEAVSCSGEYSES